MTRDRVLGIVSHERVTLLLGRLAARACDALVALHNF